MNFEFLITSKIPCCMIFFTHNRLPTARFEKRINLFSRKFIYVFCRSMFLLKFSIYWKYFTHWMKSKTIQLKWSVFKPQLSSLIPNESQQSTNCFVDDQYFCLVQHIIMKVYFVNHINCQIATLKPSQITLAMYLNWFVFVIQTELTSHIRKIQLFIHFIIDFCIEVCFDCFLLKAYTSLDFCVSLFLQNARRSAS